MRGSRGRGGARVRGELRAERGPATPRAPRRLELGHALSRDARGWTVFPRWLPEVAPGGARNIHLVSLAPGAVRGNHEHPGSTEWMLVSGGPALLLWRGPEASSPVREMQVEGDGPALFEIPPGVAHAIVSRGDHLIYALCFNDRQDPETRPCEPPLAAGAEGAGSPGDP